VEVSQAETSQMYDEPGSWPREFRRAVFWTRHLGMVAFTIAAVLVPEVGDDRVPLAISVMTVALPFSVLFHLWTRRTGRLPRAMAYVNQLLAAGFVLAFPVVWVPVLLVVLAEVAATAAAFGRRVAIESMSVGGVALVIAALVADVPEPVLGIAAFVITSGLTSFIVGGLFDAEHELRHRHVTLLDGVDAIIWESPPDSETFTYVSHQAERVLGYPVTAWCAPGFWRAHIHPDDRARAISTCEAALVAGVDHEVEYRMLAAGNRVVHLHDRVSVETDASGRPVRLRGVMVDVTAQRHAEARVRQYADIVEHIQVGLLVARLGDDDDLTIVAANPEIGMVADAEPAELVGRCVFDVLPELGADDVRERLLAVAADGTGFDIDQLAVGGSEIGERVFSLHAFPLPDRSVGISFDDVTPQSRAVSALRRQATHDALTELPNRALLHDRLRQALREARRTGTSVALLVMDLDQFKEINDALGHHTGDLLLSAMGERLAERLRECDTIARLGGDEFAILLTTAVTEQGAVQVADRVAAALDEPFWVDGLALQTNASIGIALFPQHAADHEELAQRADVAMYMAKRSGRSHAVYASEHDHSSVRRVTLLGELRRALDEDEFVLHFQPTYSLADRRIVHAEALVRWRHPTNGLLSPGEFVDLVEMSGLISGLTHRVLERAMREAATWPTDPAGAVGVSVNLSVRNLYDPHLAASVSELLAETGFPPALLTCEITESEVMDDPLLAVDVLGRLRQLGVRTSVDDFGTGRSSLAYLRHLPIDELKIDGSLVGSMRRDESEETIVRAIVDLARNLHLVVVAEGVEDDETLRRLVEFGCDRAQGFHLGRPMPASALRTLLTQTAPAHR
jgi:diguanylate cyclase (GGDEF)-like protein